jgi:thiaminase/transcriptional activator TenA
MGLCLKKNSAFSEEFWAVVVEAISQKASPALKETMKGHFIATSRYEWMFWDMAWRMETWPV